MYNVKTHLKSLIKLHYTAVTLLWKEGGNKSSAPVNQHPPIHHPLDDPYYSVLWMNFN
jgi:hypothetical protein